MGEAIPIAPEPMDKGASFDEDILAEIEKRLDQESPAQGGTAAGQKVELDKADLPLDLDPSDESLMPEPEPEPAVEIDLAGEMEQPEAGPAPDREQAKKRGLKFWLVLGLGGLLILGGAGFGAWWFFLSGPPPKKEPVAKKGPSDFYRGQVPDFTKELRVKLKPFIVPLSESEEGRILKVTVNLEVTDPDLKAQLAKHNRLIRDIIYRTLRGRLAPEIKNEKGKQLLQAQIKTELNHQLTFSPIFKVLFTEFIVTG